MSETRSTLKPNSIGLSHVVFQSVTHMAPAVSLAFTVLVAAGFVGPALPLVMIISLIAMVPVALSIGQLAKEVPSAGGLYGYASAGLGKHVGFLVGWLLLLIEPLVTPLLLLLSSFIVGDFFNTYFGVNLHWIAWVFITALVFLVLTFKDVKFSLGATLVLGFYEIVLFLVFAAFVVLKVGSENTMEVFNPENSVMGTNGLFKGVVLAITALLGYECAAAFGEEAKDPKRTIPRAMFIALIAIGLWYVFLTYAWIVGIGFDGFTKAATTDPNLIATVGKEFWGGASVLITLALINGIIANGGAAINTGSRVMFAMSRAGVLPKAFGKTHSKHQTPHVGVVFQLVAGIIIALVFGTVWDPITGLTILGLTIGVSIVVVYITCCIACIGFYRKKARKDGTKFNMLLHGVLPTIGSVAFLIPLYKNYVPLPAWPNQWSNWIVVAWLIVGIIVLAYLSKKRPESLAMVEKSLGN